MTDGLIDFFQSLALAQFWEPQERELERVSQITGKDPARD